MKTAMTVRDLMVVPGFVVCSKLLGVFGDRYARVIVLRRRKKQPSAHVAGGDVMGATINGRAGFGICRLGRGASGWSVSAGESTALGAVPCM